MFYKNEFYQKILDNLFDGVYLVDKERRITYWNKGAERITGYKSEQVLGHRCSDNLLMHVDETGATLCLTASPLMHTIEDGNEREAEVYLHHLDGYRVPVWVRAAPMVNEEGEIVGAVGITTKFKKGLLVLAVIFTILTASPIWSGSNQVGSTGDIATISPAQSSGEVVAGTNWGFDRAPGFPTPTPTPSH